MIEIEKLKVGDTVWTVSTWEWDGIRRVESAQVLKTTSKTVKTTGALSGHTNTYQSGDSFRLFHDELDALVYVANALQDKIIKVHVSLEDLKKKLEAVEARAKEIGTA